MTITGNARLAGVTGWPVRHSRSPLIHNHWLDAYAIDGAYVPLPVAPEDFETVVRALARAGFAGLNVTVPHKEAAFRTVDRLDDSARRAGAVNTIVMDDTGGLAGSNTDGFGFLQALAQGAPEWRADAGPAVVIGAGGASRAILASLQGAGVPEIRLVNRTRTRADEVAAEFGAPLVAVDWGDRGASLDGASLLVNTTTLGMTGTAALDLDLAALPVSAVVNDIVYDPLETPLLAGAARRGNRTVDGLEMLLHQARPGFAAWFGHQPEVTEALRALVRADLAGDG